MRKVLWYTCYFREYIREFTIFTLYTVYTVCWLWGCDCELYFGNLLSTLNFLKDLKVNILNRGINTLCFRSFACMYLLVGFSDKELLFTKNIYRLLVEVCQMQYMKIRFELSKSNGFLDKILLYSRNHASYPLPVNIYRHLIPCNTQQQPTTNKAIIYAPYVAGALFCNWGLLMRGRQCQV